MIRKNLFLDEKSIEQVNQVMNHHPELETFTATVRWMLQTYQESGKEKKEATKSIAMFEELKKKLNAMSKEQLLQTNGLFNLLRAMNVDVTKEIVHDPIYLDLKQAVERQIERAVVTQSSHTKKKAWEEGDEI